MICKHCRVQDHQRCDYPSGTKEQPASCTCQHRDKDGRQQQIPRIPRA